MYVTILFDWDNSIIKLVPKMYNFIVLKDNGDLAYNCGITINAIQHDELRAFAFIYYFFYHMKYENKYLRI
jgi:hypothetical protein